jgi:hypothetical protein
VIRQKIVQLLSLSELIVVSNHQGQPALFGLVENLPALFNKGITLWRILLPIRQPVGWTKEVQETLDML